MPLLLWDASALAKRYLIEVGSETVDALWSAPNVTGMAVAALGYAEAASILRRKYNSSILPFPELQEMRLALRQETFDSLDCALLTVDTDITDAIVLIDRHNINASNVSCGRQRRKGWRHLIPKLCLPPMCLRF